MKNSTLLLSLLLSATATINAQHNKPVSTKTTTEVNQCDALKKENDSLKKALGLNEPILFYTSNDVEYKLTKVIGDKKNQTVTVELLVTNKIENRDFEMLNVMGNSIKIITVNGDVLFSSEGLVPGVRPYSSTTTLHTDTPLKLMFSFGPLLPTNEYIKLFYFNYKLRNFRDSRKDNTEEIEFKNLKINWK